MAIFGFQLCFTLIMASLLQKLSPIYSFGRWLLCGGHLVRFKAPSDEDLKKALGRREEKIKGRSRKNGFARGNCENAKTFKVAKNVAIRLETEKLSRVDTILLRNYSDYEWLLNYVLCTVLVYLGTEIYYLVWKPSNSLNLSIIWIILSAWFAVRNLLSVLWLYAKSRAGGELSMSIAFAMFSFIASLAVLLIKKDFLDFDSTLSHDVASNETRLYHSLFASRLQISLAIYSALIGLLFIFPAIRLAQMYVDATKHCSGLLQATLHVNFFAPALISVMWVKPLMEATVQDPRSGLALADPVQIEVFRIILVIFVVILRIALTRQHMQAYLNLAHERLLKLHKESGTITNVDLQRLVSQVYYYLGVVAVQYVSPTVLLLCSALILKTCGGYSWQAISRLYEAPAVVETSVVTSRGYIGDVIMKELTASFGEKWFDASSVLTPPLVRGICSYTLWWCTTNWFVASCVGLFYHHYLAG